MRPGPWVTILALCCLALLGGCRRPAQTAQTAPSRGQARLSVVVSIPPQAYWVEHIAGDHATVEVLVEPGQSHATFEPTPKQMAIIERSDVYFRIGVPFEGPLLRKIQGAMPHLRVVDLREGITLRKMVSHSEGDHDHGDADPHTWLDPALVKTQVATIVRTLGELLPSEADTFAANEQALFDELDALDAEIAEVLRPYAGYSVLVYHPAYGYFADRYGLRQVPIEVEGKEPSGRELTRIVASAREAHTTTVFTQPGFATTSAEAVAREIGGRLVTLPLQERDYPSSLRRIAELIADELSHAR